MTDGGRQKSNHENTKGRKQERNAVSLGSGEEGRGREGSSPNPQNPVNPV
jgi:hypothetical protein